MIKIGFAPKTVALEDGTYLHFWYANNRGRGGNNVTIIRSTVAERAPLSAKQTGVMCLTYTSGWRGNVNFSRAIQNDLAV